MNKAILLTLALASATAVASAQDFKQAAGSKTLEVQFAPLGGSPIGLSGIQFRSFKTEVLAYRANIFIGFNNKSELAAKDPKSFVTAPQLKTTNTSFEISLQPGFEKHMAGTDQLSPYWGAILDIGFKTSSEKKEHLSGMSANGLADSVKVETTTTSGKDGFFRIGAGLVLGTDYYFAKKFYIGAECGFGLGYKLMSTIKVEESEVTKPVTKAAEDQKQGNSFDFGPTVNAKLRLGWNF